MTTLICSCIIFVIVAICVVTWQYETSNIVKSYYIDLLVRTIAECIGSSEYAEVKNCINELDSIKKEAIDMLVSEGYSGKDIKKGNIHIILGQ